MYIFLFTVLLLLLAYAILMAYYNRAWNKIPAYVNTPSATLNIKVTVIIPARNEEKNIGNCLTSILHQSYPSDLLEVIVVDDHSTDRTVEIVQSFKRLSVTLLRLQDFTDEKNLAAHKKKAIEIAIKKSSGEMIVTTDADCVAPINWIYQIVDLYIQREAVFIAAPVKLVDRHSLLSIFQSLDFITMQGITGAAVYKKIYPMCNGANLAYSKKVFEEVDGFKGVDTIASGDDMFLMQKVSMKFPERVYFLKSKDAIVETEPAATWKAFLNQRVRWSSKADKYDNKKIFLTLLFVYVLNFCLLVFLIASFWTVDWLLVFLIFIIAKTIIEFPFVRTVANFFGQAYLMRYFFFLQPLHIAYIVIAGTLGKFGSYEWKNRKVK